MFYSIAFARWGAIAGLLLADTHASLPRTGAGNGERCVTSESCAQSSSLLQWNSPVKEDRIEPLGLLDTSGMERRSSELAQKKLNALIQQKVQSSATLPMVDVFGVSKVDEALVQREQWIRDVIQAFDSRAADEAGDWRRYDFFGPVYSLCPDAKLGAFGIGDEEKRICDLSKLSEVHGPCEIIAIGSEGRWEFEKAIYHGTSCRVHTFDCTGDYPVPNEISSRVFSYKKCIGSSKSSKNTDPNSIKAQLADDQNYLPYGELLKLANIQGSPTYLKMDVEGFEWNVLPDMMGSVGELPEQIGFEIHYHRLMDHLGWSHAYKTQAEIAMFGEMLFRAGYVPIHRRDNKYGVPGEATEYLMARVARRVDRAEYSDP